MTSFSSIAERFDQATRWLAGGQHERAIAAYREILSKDPTHRASCNNLAACLFGMQHYAEALQWFSRLAGNSPEDALAHYNAGRCLKELGDTAQAARAYRQALILRPDYREARENLANLLADMGQPEAALPLYEEGIVRDPDCADNYRQAAFQLRDRGMPGDVERARAILQQGIDRKIQGADALSLVGALLMAPVADSAAEIRSARSHLAAALARFKDAPLSIADPLREVGMVPFYLAYHGESDRALNEGLATVLRQACPDLTFVSPRQPAQRRSRPRIGVVTTSAGQHTTARYFKQSLQALSAYADLRVFYAGAEWRQQFDSGSLPVWGELPGELDRCHALLAEESLDVLIYPEIGMHPLPWFLAHARLAPVQIALYGQPVTTGIPTVDYFLSHRGSELDNAQEDYSERLLMLPADVSAACISARSCDVPRRTRADFGLPDGKHIYLCAQSLFKIHPDFDLVLAEILRRDVDGEVVVFATRDYWSERMLARLRQAMPDVVGRVRMMPFLPLPEFLAFAALCDVALDTQQYSGGGTSYDCLQAGLPIVTLPGRFMRARQTAALYQKMDLPDLIAKNREDYLRIALSAAVGATDSMRLKRAIKSRSARLYDDRQSAAAFCELILDARPVQ